MSKAYGIEEARKILGDLVTAAQYGQTAIITRNGKPIARIVPIEEPAMASTFTSRDLRDQVVTYTDASDGEYDVDAITEEIIERHGAVPVNDIDSGEFAEIVLRHATD